MLFSTKSKCSSTEYILDSNYSDEIVSLAIRHSESPTLCAEFEVLVSVIGINASELQTFNITGQIMPPSKNHMHILLISDSNINDLLQYL